MKLHFSIATAAGLLEKCGIREMVGVPGGIPARKVRHSRLRRRDAQLRQLFGSAVPAFPPKFYLAMTKSMADERQSQLEQYLQNVVKKVADFELSYLSLQRMKELHCKLEIRKWYEDPSLDILLMDCRASLNLLYMQAIQEVERNWVKLTEEQMQELEFLQKNPNKVKFLEQIREMPFYVFVTIQKKAAQLASILAMGVTKDGKEDTLKLRFEYNDSGTWQWIILHTKQKIKIPESVSMKNRKKKSSIQQKRLSE